MSALAKTSTANAQATQHRTSPFSTASPSTCSNRTKPANAESTENASRPVGTMTTYFNSSDIKMRLPWTRSRSPLAPLVVGFKPILPGRVFFSNQKDPPKQRKLGWAPRSYCQFVELHGFVRTARQHWFGQGIRV